LAGRGVAQPCVRAEIGSAGKDQGASGVSGKADPNAHGRHLFGPGAASPTSFPASTLSNLNQVYSGAPESATATISGLGTSSFTFTYNGSATPPTAAGSYQGSIAGTLVIAKAGSTTTLTLGAEFVGGTVTSNGSPHGATAKWASTGVDGATGSLSVTYLGINGTSYASSTSAPTNAGQYVASASFAGDANHTGSSGYVDFTIAPAVVTATVTLGNLSQTYTGMPLSASSTTNAPGTSFTFTYNGSATPPTAAGSYTVVATLVNASYHGSATGTLVIAKATLPVVVNSDLMLANTQNSGCYGNNLQPGWGICGITPATLTNACFADSNDRGPLSDFRVTAASWGDGCIDSTGLNFAGSSGNYSINGAHMYTLPGIYTFANNALAAYQQQGNGFCTNGALEAYMLALADALQAANNNTSFAS
jgi:MBG domain